MQYGLIGEHLGHSYSTYIHKAIADYEFELREIAPEDIDEFLTKKDFKAINVTIPYKQTVIPYLDEISEQAKAIGAVNVIVNRDGRLCGYNTDFMGMKALIARMGIEVKGRKVLILGTGGTSKTAYAVVTSLGASEVIKVSRRSGDGAISYDEAEQKHKDAEVIINTTPVGMFPKVSGRPIDVSAFPRVKGVVDAVYNPLRTVLVRDAQKAGIAAEGGLYMLCGQGVYASALFLGKEVDEGLIEKAYRALLTEKENIVLIGMPTSGKTTVGRIVAAKLGREFYDLDEVLTKKLMCTSADYIRANGEAAFRAAEHEAAAEIAGMSGCVIATGGGTVLDPSNVQALKANGRVFFLDRELANLMPAKDRPLSSDPEALKKLYETRYPIYRASADVTVDANVDADTVAEQIMRKM